MDAGAKSYPFRAEGNNFQQGLIPGAVFQLPVPHHVDGSIVHVDVHLKENSIATRLASVSIVGHRAARDEPGTEVVSSFAQHRNLPCP